MAVATRGNLVSLADLGMRDFSGGWNIRDAPTELQANESPDLLNMSLDERGGAVKRLGMVKYNATPFAGGAPPQNLWEWKTKARILTQCGTGLFRDDSATVTKTFTTADRCGFAEFGDEVFATHPVDGLFKSTDGLTWTAVAGAPKGSVIIPWQGRLVSLGDPGNPPRLSASKLGDATVWTTGTDEGWTNDVRELDSLILVAAEGGSGVDILGRPGLILFKERSTYRVYDPVTGAYETIDSTTGAASSLATEAMHGRIYVISPKGLFVTDGVHELKEVSEKISRLFVRVEVNLARLDLWCAGKRNDRLVFSLPRLGSNANNLELEYHPEQAWITPHDSAASCYASFESGTRVLYAGSPTVNGQVYQRDRTGADDGQPISCRVQSKWFEPSTGRFCNFRSVRVFGRGVFTLHRKLDFDQGDGVGFPLILAAGAAVWDESLWDVGSWGPVNYEDHQDLWSLGQGIAISFELKETSTLTASAPKLLEGVVAAEIGSCALYGLQLQYTPTGK